MAASTTYTDTSDLSGFLKPVFGELQWLLPEDALCQKTFAFNAANSVGQYFTEPLQVTTSWGVSFLGSDTSVQALNESVPSNTVPAQVTPYLTVLNDKISYGMFDRGPEAGKKAFMSTGAYVGKNLALQMRRILEISCLCGQDGFATVETYSSSGTGSVVVTAASLRPGVLAMLEGARIDVVRSGNLYANNGGSTSIAGIGITVLSVDIDARTITFSALPFMGSGAATLAGGDILFLHGAAGQAPAGSNTPGAVAVSYMEMIGLRKQISATSGTIFAINKATYLAVRGNTVTSIGPISAGAILKCVAKAVNRGLQGRAVCFISPTSWQELNSRNIAQQVFDQSYSPAQAKVGTDAIEIRGQGVTVEVMSHAMMPDGELMILPKDNVKRIGSAYENSGPDGDTDISFMIPGTSQRFVDPVPGFNAVKVECRSDQQIYLQKPAFAVHGTGITHT
jgi:hypothetical protein